MFFSVVIPLYNKELFVRETLQSVLAQTHRDFEVIVVDDCSTDNSLQVVESFSDERIRIIKHVKNQGLSASRNMGISVAKSDLVTFIDADDLWLPDFLQKMAELIKTFPAAGLYASNYLEQFGEKRIPPKQNLNIREGEIGIIDDYFEAAIAQPILWYGSAVVRKSTFEKVGDFDENITLCEDVDFNIRANQQVKFAFYNLPLAIYRVFSQNQIMNSPLSGKTYPDFDKYEPAPGERTSLKRYLDMNRYFFAMRHKLSGETRKSDEIISKIHWKKLTSGQKIMLKSPVLVANLLRKVKLFLVGKGIRVTSFD